MSKMLLLADDSVTIRKVVELIFAHSEYGLKCVGNGDDALEQARLSRPDMVLADVNMPGRDGYDLCAAIKADPALKQIPVLMLAGAFESFDEEKARSVGADSWIAKPFESQALIDEVEGLLARSSAAAETPIEEESDIWTGLGFDPAGFHSEESEQAAGDQVSNENESGGQWIDEEAPLEEAVAAGPFDYASPALETEESGFATEEEFLFIDETDLLEDEQTEMESPIDTDLNFAFDETEEAEPDTLSEPLTEEILAEELKVDSAHPDEEVLAATEPEVVEPETYTAPPEEGTVEPEAVAGIAAQAAVPMPQKGHGLDYFRNSGLISRLAEPAISAAPAPEPAQAAEVMSAEPVSENEGLTEREVEQRVLALSEEQLNQIVERVAGTVIERLAGSILEKIAWEVVPDLAEVMIKEEIRKITEPSH